MFSFLVITSTTSYFRQPLNSTIPFQYSPITLNESEELSINAGIHIVGNSELAAAASSGSGTSEDPYIIENIDFQYPMVVFGDGIYVGIFICNTTKNFILRNCTISLLGESSSYYIAPYGIWLDNVINASLTNNSIQSYNYYMFTRGIYLTNSWNNNLSKNNISHLQFGLFLENSNSNRLIENNIYSDWIGLFSENSNSNRLIENNIYSNWNGLYLENSNNNTISYNDINENSYGLGLRDFSNYNTISENLFYSNRLGIVEESSCVGNIFTNNTIVDRIDADLMDLPVIAWLIPTLIGIGIITIWIYKKKKS